MAEPAFIEHEGRRTHAVVPIAEWERIQALLEDRLDVLDAARILADPAEYRLPLEVAERIADGVHPLKAIREWRGLSQAELAQRAGVAQPTVARIEGGARAGSVATLRKLAHMLGVPTGALHEQT